MKQNYKTFIFRFSFAMIVGIMFFIVGGVLAQSQNKVLEVNIVEPMGTSVFPGDGKVYVQWNSVSDPNLAGYIVYRDDTKYGNYDNGIFTLIDTVAKEDTVYVDNTVSNLNNYKYWVTAYDGEMQSEPSPDYTGLFAYPRPRVDKFGYTWSSNRDSDDAEAPVYQWNDISSTGTPVPMSGDNVNTGFYPVGFYFPFYNFTFDSFRISTNGIISFTSSTTQYDIWNEFPFYGGGKVVMKNNSYEDGNILAPFWADMYFPGEQTSAYYQNFGDYMIIQFDHVVFPQFKTSDFGLDNTFQVILYNNGQFEFVYEKMDEPWGLIIGWQNYSLADGITVTFKHGEMQPVLEGIEFENLVIRGGYDFSGVETQVPNLFTFELNMLNKVQVSPDQNKIYSIPVTGIFSTIVQNRIYEAKDVALDMSKQKIYWLDWNQQIMRSDFDGAKTETFLVLDGDFDNPNNIAIDSHNGYLFLSDYNFQTIKRVKLDGTNLITLAKSDSGVQVPEVIALDIEHEKIYWTDGEMQSIYWMNYDGSGLEPILQGDTYYDLVVYPGENTIYYVNGSYQINRIDLDGSNEDIVAEPGADVMDIALDANANRLYYTYSNYGFDSGIGYIDLDTIDEFYIIEMLDYLNTLNIDLPLAPVHPEVNAKVGYVEIKWPANTDASLSGYKIFRGISSYPNTEYVTLPAAEGDTVVFKDYDIVHGQKYFYRLVSLDDRGLYSAFSIQKSAVAAGPPDIVLSTNDLDFGGVPNNESEIETFTVYNNGDTELTIFEMGFNHGDYFHFPEVKSNTWIISPGDSLIVAVGFFPGIGNFTDSIYVLSDDIIPESDSLQYVALSGVGLNHAPTTFNLIEPVHLDSLTIEEFNELTFKWHSAADEDMDDLTYNVVIADLESDTTFRDISDTSFTVQLVNFLDYDKPYAWSVFVTDGQSITVSADTFGFFTPLLSAIGDGEGTLPTVYKLHNNYPNPFNPTTTVNYDLPRASHVSLSVYNVLGQLVKVLVDGEQPLGSHTVVWDGKDRFRVNVSSGIYMLVMRSGDFTSVQKMALMK